MGALVKQRYMLSVMCGRSTYKLTWEEIVRLYRLTLDQPPVNTRARYNVCPTTTIDTIVGTDGVRHLVPMRWGLVPSWWSKPLKELRLATFNARAETVAEKPFFRSAFKHNRCLIPVSGYYEWQDTPSGKQPCYFTARDGSPALTIAGLMGRMARPGERRDAQILHHDYHRAQQLRGRGARSNAGFACRERLRALAVRRRRYGITQTGGRGPVAAVAGVEASEQLTGI